MGCSKRIQFQTYGTLLAKGLVGGWFFCPTVTLCTNSERRRGRAWEWKSGSRRVASTLRAQRTTATQRPALSTMKRSRYRDWPYIERWKMSFRPVIVSSHFSYGCCSHAGFVLKLESQCCFKENLYMIQKSHLQVNRFPRDAIPDSLLMEQWGLFSETTALLSEGII